MQETWSSLLSNADFFVRFVAEILGPQDAPNVYDDSSLAYSPSTILGDSNALQSGGDSFLSFSHNTWASFVSDGYTEFIEVSQ